MIAAEAENNGTLSLPPFKNNTYRVEVATHGLIVQKIMVHYITRTQLMITNESALVLS